MLAGKSREIRSSNSWWQTNKVATSKSETQSQRTLREPTCGLRGWWGLFDWKWQWQSHWDANSQGRWLTQLISDVLNQGLHDCQDCANFQTHFQGFQVEVAGTLISIECIVNDQDLKLRVCWATGPPHGFGNAMIEIVPLVFRQESFLWSSLLDPGMALADAYEAGDVEVRPDITELLYLVLDNKPQGASWSSKGGGFCSEEFWGRVWP